MSMTASDSIDLMVSETRKCFDLVVVFSNIVSTHKWKCDELQVVITPMHILLKILSGASTDKCCVVEQNSLKLVLTTALF